MNKNTAVPLFVDPLDKYLKQIKIQLDNREIRSRYKERKNQIIGQGEELCIFGCSGWFCLKTEHEKHHDVNLNGILTLSSEDLANLDINKLICPYHIFDLKMNDYAEMWHNEPEKIERIIRIEIYCKLNNIKNILRYFYWKKDRAKIENNINAILESKFTAREKKGHF